MLRSLPRVAAGALTLVVAAAGLAVATTTARAAVVGDATLSQSTGSSLHGLAISTDGPCAEPATRVRVRVNGAGFGAGINAMTVTTIGFSTTEPMTNLQFRNTFKGFAEEAGNVPLVGDYDVRVQCQNNLGTVVYDEYQLTMVWTTPGNSFDNIDAATFTSYSGPAVDAPINTAPPAVTGTPQVGQTLGCSPGTWTGATSYAYTWLRGGAPVPGAAQSTYVLTSADAGAHIACRVTAAGTGGSLTVTSAAVGLPSMAR